MFATEHDTRAFPCFIYWSITIWHHLKQHHRPDGWSRGTQSLVETSGVSKLSIKTLARFPPCKFLYWCAITLELPNIVLVLLLHPAMDSLCCCIWEQDVSSRSTPQTHCWSIFALFRWCTEVGGHPDCSVHPCTWQTDALCILTWPATTFLAVWAAVSCTSESSMTLLVHHCHFHEPVLMDTEHYSPGTPQTNGSLEMLCPFLLVTHRLWGPDVHMLPGKSHSLTGAVKKKLFIHDVIKYIISWSL